MGKHTAGPAGGAGAGPLQPPTHTAPVRLLPLPALAGAKAPQCEPVRLNQYLLSENNLSPLSVTVPVTSNTLFTSTWKGNTDIQAVSDFPNAIPSPRRCLICQGLVAVNLRLLCFPAVLFYSYLHCFKGIPLHRRSQFMTDFLSSSSNSHMKTWRKKITFFFFKLIFFIHWDCRG